MDRSENIKEHAKYKIDKTIIAEITLIHEITNVSGKLVFVLISNDITSWFKTLDITTPENRPIKIAVCSPLASANFWWPCTQCHAHIVINMAQTPFLNLAIISIDVINMARRKRSNSEQPIGVGLTAKQMKRKKRRY